MFNNLTDLRAVHCLYVLTHPDSQLQKQAINMKGLSKVLSRTASKTMGRPVAGPGAAPIQSPVRQMRVPTPAQQKSITTSMATKVPPPPAKSLATRAVAAVTPAVKAVAAPRSRPAPALVEANIGKPLPSRAGRALNTVANVPAGERFRQRPVMNTAKLLSADGVPGMRRLNQAAAAGLVYSGARGLSDANQAVNDSIYNTTSDYGVQAGLTPNQRRRLSEQGQKVKQYTLQDATLGRLKRNIFGHGGDEAAVTASKYRDELYGLALNDAMKYQLSKPAVGRGMLDSLMHYRSPAAAAVSGVQQAGKNYLGGHMEYNDPAAYAGPIQQMYSTMRPENEQDAKDMAAAAVQGGWKHLTPEQQRKLIEKVGPAAIAAMTASVGR